MASLFPKQSATDAYYEQKTKSEREAADKAAGRKSGGFMQKTNGGGVRLADGGMAPSGAEYHDGSGNFYDADGYLVE